MNYLHGTWLDEVHPEGRGHYRAGRALFVDGKFRRVWAGGPDAFATCPARVRIAHNTVHGFVAPDDDGVLIFTEVTR